MNRKKLVWVGGIAASLLVAWLAMSLRSRSAPGRQPRPNDPTQSSAGVIRTNLPADAIAAALESAAQRLESARTPDERNAAMAQLRKALSSGSADEIASAVRHLLSTRTDAPTGEGFRIATHGSLAESPTLRTWLLDQLATYDPAAAAAYAKEILKTSESPDEWAIAFRNLARVDTSADAQALLQTKMVELFRNEAWQGNPSVGYLEAFDTTVHLGGTALLPPLTELVSKKDNQAVAHAAFLTLDRLTINQPIETLSALAQHPEWMQGREETRANYFARADVGDPTQRQLVEAYLLDAGRSPAELQTFAGVFPNANFMVSQNLLTTIATPDGATLARRDRASLAAVNEWLADPRFASLRPQLERMKVRLEGFVRPQGP